MSNYSKYLVLFTGVILFSFFASCKTNLAVKHNRIIELELRPATHPRTFAKKYSFLKFKALSSKRNNRAIFFVINMDDTEVRNILSKDTEFIKIISPHKGVKPGKNGKKASVKISSK